MGRREVPVQLAGQRAPWLPVGQRSRLGTPEVGGSSVAGTLCEALGRGELGPGI